jgi:hypothetical protein
MKRAWQYFSQEAVTLLGFVVAATGLMGGVYVVCHSCWVLLSRLS